MSRAVWDASAVLLVLFREPSWEDWAPSLPESVVSTVNLIEVMTKIMALGGVPVATREVLNALPIEIRSFTRDALTRRPLDAGQLRYAALDAEVLMALYRHFAASELSCPPT